MPGVQSSKVGMLHFVLLENVWSSSNYSFDDENSQKKPTFNCVIILFTVTTGKERMKRE